MISQPIWIGIVIAAFVVGLGGTYLIFHTGSSDVAADFNMMENAQHAQEITNQEIMMQMMDDDPNSMKDMIISSMKDSDQMQMMEDMMADMINRMQTDPQLEKAMIEHMDKMKASMNDMMDMNP